MFSLRFSLFSVLAMVLATAVVTVIMLQDDGGGFGGAQGTPFAWYWWTDCWLGGRNPGGYQWPGLVADVVIWGVAIIAFGWLVERITQRFFRRHDHRTVA
ncbi:MAG: hypothetical protein K8T90_07100 [Planctomycetes bacterium]|nr:hypothetical protein [Planctomycetota bacterium]